MSQHDDKVYLGHILESIKKIEQYLGDCDFKQFETNGLLVDGIIRNFEIIGEASNNISGEFKENNRGVNFRPAVSMRNRLAHGYDDINLHTIWDAIKQDLPVLETEIEKLLDQK